VTGLGILLRTFLRRDWLMILCWVAGGTILYWSQGISVKGLYATQAEFDRAAASMENNAALIAMVGPARALNTVGGQVMWQSAALGAIVAGLMSMFLIGRHTRVEEETGRDELLRAAPIGRLAPMTAALGVAVIANLAMGLAITASLVTLPLEGADSLATGLGLTGVGWVFSGVALVAAQLTQSPRAMYGVVGVAMGAAYVLRAVGDIGNGLFSWLSPIGWYQAMHPFSGLRWWPMLLLVAASVVGVVAAYQLFARRDIGSGMLAARPGPGRAGEGLVAGERLGLGLAWRLQRGTAFGWAAGLFLGGLSYGSIGNDIGDMVGDGEAARDMFVQAGDLVNGFYATAILMLAMIATGFAVSSAIRPRGEEDANHAEVLLATATPRSGWLGGHVLVTVVGTLLVLVCAGLGLGLGNAMVTGDAGAVTRLGVPVLAMTAPVLVVSGVARLLYGVAPRLVHLAWLVVALAVVVMMFGELLRIPQWIQDLSPFEHLALVPAEDFRWTPFLAVLALAAALSVAGQLAFRRRDVH
jgi:ABC-2 type transport system permease protein